MLPSRSQLLAQLSFQPSSVLLAYLGPTLVGVIALMALYVGDLDGQLVDPFFERATGTWPLKDQWLVSGVLHSGGKFLIIALGLGCLGIVSMATRFERIRPWRRSALYLLLCIALTTSAVGLLKASSPIPVPWRAARFGGSTPHYLPFFAPDGAPHGGGWPCAHASGAFAMMGLYFIGRESSQWRAWVGLAAACGLGIVYAAAQVMRGAHFPSHGVWSFLLAWTICASLYVVVFQSHLTVGSGARDFSYRKGA